MEKYEWKQWKGFKKLHAVTLWNPMSYYVAVCGISQPEDFVEPQIVKTKCKNCERKFNGKRN